MNRQHDCRDDPGLLRAQRQYDPNDTRTSLPAEMPRLAALRFDEVPSSDRGVWRYPPTRHIYHALKLLADGADAERAVNHLVDSTDF